MGQVKRAIIMHIAVDEANEVRRHNVTEATLRGGLVFDIEGEKK